MYVHERSNSGSLMLALINKKNEVSPSIFVQCCRLSKNRKSQLYTQSLIGRSAHFSRRVECRTASNALEKSKAIRCTYGYSSRSLVIWCVRFMSALVVDPVGRKAY